MTESSSANVPYPVIAQLFRDSGIIPFLGAGASLAGATGGTPLPSGGALTKDLARASRYPGDGDKDPLTKVSQYLEEIQADRDFLLGKIADIFYARVAEAYQSSLTLFLARLPVPLRPKLIITTNYDLLMEKTFPAGAYLAISQIRRGADTDKFLCCTDWRTPVSPSEVLTIRELDDYLETFRTEKPDAVIIYKIHGTARLMTTDKAKIDSIVLTENDYVDFLATEKLRKVPSLVLDGLLKRNLLFLGYSLQDWNFRVLLRRLSSIREGRRRQYDDNERKHWAILQGPDMVESKFWGKRNVNLYDVTLESFLADLAQELGLPA